MKALSIVVLAAILSTSAVHASECTESYRICMNVCADKVASERCMFSCHIARNFCAKTDWREKSERAFDAVAQPAPLRKESWGRTSTVD